MEKQQVRKRRGRPAKACAPRREVILEVALPIFAANGFDNTNLRQIAAAADVDVALIAHQFGTKLKLWQTVVDGLAENLLATTADIIAAEAGTLRKAAILRHAMEHVIDVFCDEPVYAMLMVHQAPQESVQFEYSYERLCQPYEQLLLPLVNDALAEGELPEVDPSFFIFNFISALLMLVAMRRFLARSTPRAIDDRDFRVELKRSLLASLASHRQHSE